MASDLVGMNRSKLTMSLYFHPALCNGQVVYFYFPRLTSDELQIYGKLYGHHSMPIVYE